MFGTGLTTDTTGPGAPRVVKGLSSPCGAVWFFQLHERARASLPVNISIAKIAKKANPNSPFPHR